MNDSKEDAKVTSPFYAGSVTSPDYNEDSTQSNKLLTWVNDAQEDHKASLKVKDGNEDATTYILAPPVAITSPPTGP